MGTHRRILGLGLILGLAASPISGAELRDLYFGDALYQAYQGRYFEAIQRLDTELALYHGLDEPDLDTLHYHVGDAEFSVGDFELDYRMHHRAGRAITAVLEGSVDEAVRNEAAYRLARIHFQKGQLDEALRALARIQGEVPAGIRGEIEFLRANILMATGRPGDAVEVLEGLRAGTTWDGFTAYNLGIALLQEGRTRDAIEQLDAAGTLAGDDPAERAIRDKSNLVLGALLFDEKDFPRARESLDRVRLDGPFSNQALLRAGWAETSAGNYDRALVPWNLLAEREPTDASVQEAMLAVPQAYASLNLHGRAAILFGRALENFGREIDSIDASIGSIRDGRFLDALSRQEARQVEDWVIRLRQLPGEPETFYLMDLAASHDFQTAVQNYLDLEDLRSKLLSWAMGLDAFEDIIRLRGENYDPLLPGIDAQFRELDSRMRLRLEQRKQLAKRLDSMLTAPRPELLATADERIAGETIRRLQELVAGEETPEAAELLRRAARLQGVLTWSMETEYHERLTEAHAHLHELNTCVDALDRQYEQFVRTRQASTHSYVGYDARIERLRERVRAALQRVDLLLARQGHLIETVAIHRLQDRRERLVAQQTRARFAVADSYDRASRASVATEGP